MWSQCPGIRCSRLTIVIGSFDLFILFLGKSSSEVILWISLVRFHSWLLVAGYFLHGTRLRLRIALLLVTRTSRSRILWSHRFVSGWCVSGAARRCPISTFAWIDTTMERRRHAISSRVNIYQRVFSADIEALEWERKKKKTDKNKIYE